MLPSLADHRYRGLSQDCRLPGSRRLDNASGVRPPPPTPRQGGDRTSNHHYVRGSGRPCFCRAVLSIAEDRAARWPRPMRQACAAGRQGKRWLRAATCCHIPCQPADRRPRLSRFYASGACGVRHVLVQGFTKGGPVAMRTEHGAGRAGEAGTGRGRSPRAAARDR